MNRRDFIGTMAVGSAAMALPTDGSGLAATIAKLAGLGWAWQITSDGGAAIVALPEAPGHRRIELRGPAEAIPGMLQKALLQRYEEAHG